MDRLFLDANVLFSADYKADARVVRLWRLDDVVLCSSRYALEEARFNLEDEDQLQRLGRLSSSLRLFEPGSARLPRGISLPDKDEPILLAALEARATHLLTGDIRHFGPYLGKSIAGLLIVLPGEYLRSRSRSHRD
jgi:HEAT repeat protein